MLWGSGCRAQASKDGCGLWCWPLPCIADSRLTTLLSCCPSGDISGVHWVHIHVCRPSPSSLACRVLLLVLVVVLEVLLLLLVLLRSLPTLLLRRLPPLLLKCLPPLLLRCLPSLLLRWLPLLLLRQRQPTSPLMWLM